MQKILIFAADLAIGNFIWHCFFDRDWMKAVEHSYYQTFALVLWHLWASH